MSCLTTNLSSPKVNWFNAAIFKNTLDLLCMKLRLMGVAGEKVIFFFLRESGFRNRSLWIQERIAKGSTVERAWILAARLPMTEFQNNLWIFFKLHEMWLTTRIITDVRSLKTMKYGNTQYPYFVWKKSCYWFMHLGKISFVFEWEMVSETDGLIAWYLCYLFLFMSVTSC